MLKDMDLNKHIEKQEFKARMEELEPRLAELQRRIKDAGIPVIIVFEGWEASGKGTFINELIMPLDPRGFNVYSIHEASEDEVFRPLMWPFWTRTPARGRIAIFDRSWYNRTVREYGRKSGVADGLARHIESVNDFEEELSLDGTLIIKFFLHISQKEQKRRLRKLESDPASAWRVKDSDWYENQHYEKLLERTQRMYEATDTDIAPWCIVEAEDRRFARLKIFLTVIERMEERLASQGASSRRSADAAVSANAGAGEADVKVRSSVLDHVDMSSSIDDQHYDRELKQLQKKLRSYEYRIYKERIPVLILFEGWDAAGKGGAIRRLTANLDPRGYEVIPVSAPSEAERTHHYLWRFWQRIPKAGHISIFDRTWYGRVLVERVEGFCRPDEWQRAYPEINSMEKQIVEFGAVLVKFWLQVDKDEQLKRFEERQGNPEKQWKITDEDWRNRDKWEGYWAAADEMLLRTSTSFAPWTVVEANDKRFARIKVLRTVLEALEKKLF